MRTRYMEKTTRVPISAMTTRPGSRWATAICGNTYRIETEIDTLVMRDDHMKSAMPEIGAAEFKAKCLELINDIHARKRNFVIITKRGKPYAKLVPVDSKDEPLYGCMKGLAR